ncbi:DUF1822 family protein [Iningainema tapete]|uniref:DUF1822 family protein n=1 Tax=Iningainema tapete BLCC-T55 TaxID=2748662 RepID=A0A8J7BWI5_9CYAN|nr:DUF1822 family protein [Iningainema tapete]MBD2771003.1 DUF1822 family protein [Iningainema tapete BLCC-T55]
MSTLLLTTLYSDQMWLESQQQLEQTIAREQRYSCDVAKNTAINNRLTLEAFSSWLRAESGIYEQLKVLPSLDALPSIWEMVNGTAIQVGKTRIVLIPSDEIDTDEFCVPAEWIDIPSWRADYYIAVQVNTEDGWLRFWGYTTYKMLKEKGEYDQVMRTYSLEPEELIEDINIMWVARSLGGDYACAVKPLPTLSQAQAETLLTQLSQKTCYSPRLKVDFEQWGALIENETWRQNLYQQRISSVVPSQIVWQNLSKWFENIFAQGWQTVEDVLAPTELIPVLGANNPEPDRESKIKAIASIIPLLQPHHDELLRRQAAGVLGKIGVGNNDVSTALTELMHTAREEKTRWQAAISLEKIDPNHPQAGRQRAKLIDLGMQLDGNPVALIVAVMPRADRKISVFLQVQPTKAQTNLPPGLKLGLLSELDEIIREIEARSDATGQGKDDSIQLAFNCSPGNNFRVKITCNNVSFTESFAI